MIDKWFCRSRTRDECFEVTVAEIDEKNHASAEKDVLDIDFKVKSLQDRSTPQNMGRPVQLQYYN